jgi:molybdenum-dependent DNA-binding transcriptional regulator ModE
MRVLNTAELGLVAGGTGVCTPDGNTYGGVADTTSVGQELVNIYEALVFATSHVIERVVNAL